MASDYKDSMNKEKVKCDSRFVLEKRFKMRIAAVPSLCFNRVRMQREHQSEKIQIG